MSDSSQLLEWRQRWNQRLFQFLRRRVRSNVDVQDLAQETYLRLLRASDLSEVRNPLAYLLQVANHVALEWRDRQSRNESAVLAEDVLIDNTLPELELDARLSQQRLDATLAAVSPMMRAVLLLKLRDERSNQEIAAALLVTDRQVRRYVARGYELLRQAMEG